MKSEVIELSLVKWQLLLATQKKKTKSMCGNGTLYQGFLQVEKVWLLESRNRTHTFAGIVQLELQNPISWQIIFHQRECCQA